MRKSFYSLSGIVTNEMKRDVQDGEAFIFVNRSLTSMKILHAEYGGLVIYNLKLEKGCISLPDMRLDDDIITSILHSLSTSSKSMFADSQIGRNKIRRNR